MVIVLTLIKTEISSYGIMHIISTNTEDLSKIHMGQDKTYNLLIEFILLKFSYGKKPSNRGHRWEHK